MVTRTNDLVEITETYVSSCPCRARRTLRAGQSAPECPTCRKPVSWNFEDPSLRKEDPGLDTLLAGRPPPGRSALRHKTAVLWAIYLVPPVLIALGLVLHVMALVVAGVEALPEVSTTTTR